MIFKEKIIIDSRLTPECQWEDFGHELCHYLFHFGNQLSGSGQLSTDYEEWKANNCMMHFCIPTFMLKKVLLEYEVCHIPHAIPIVKENFNVTYDLAEKN